MFGIKKKKKVEQNSNSEQFSESGQQFDFGSSIEISEISFDSLSKQNELIEIKEPGILSMIDSYIPQIVKIREKSAVKLPKPQKGEKQHLFSVNLKKGEELADAKTGGGKRGFIKGEKGRIIHHENFNEINVPETANAKNIISGVMGIASLVVGQYYMAQVNEGLSKISDAVANIGSFQNNEYKSRILAVATQTKVISAFQFEAFRNEELRKNEISKLQDLKAECMQLLGQANFAICEIATKENLEYSKYEKELITAQKWIAYQNALLKLMYKIADLQFALYVGKVSRDHCTIEFSEYLQHSKTALSRLKEWNNKYLVRLEINLDEGMRKRDGIDGIIHWVPGLFKESYRYRTIPKDMISYIEMQENVDNSSFGTNENLYQKDVRLIIKDGKVYYMPEKATCAEK